MNQDMADYEFAMGKPEPKPQCTCIVRHTPKLTIYNSHVCPVHRNQVGQLPQPVELK